MTLLTQLNEVRVQLQSGRLMNEADRCHWVILPILHSLGWTVCGTSIIVPQFPIGSRRVDYALCSSPVAHPLIFVELKEAGKANVTDSLLFDYALDQDVPFIITTDGRKWHFYLPSEEGEYKDRSFYKLDLIESDPEDAAKFFERYLDFNKVVTGEALEAAKNDYQNIINTRKITITLKQAWSKLLEERDELLLKLLAEKVEDLCGLKPELKTCSDFIANLFSQNQLEIAKNHEPIAISTKPVTRRNEARGSSMLTPSITPGESYSLEHLSKMNLVNTKPFYLQVADQQISTKTWADLCVKLVEWLINEGHLRHNHLPIHNAAGKDKYFINLKPEHQSKHKDGCWKQVKDLFIDVKYNARYHVSNIIHTLQELKLHDLDLRIALSVDPRQEAETELSQIFDSSVSDDEDLFI